MPTIARSPETSGAVAMHHSPAPRRGSSTVGVITTPPKDLLPSGGAHHRAFLREVRAIRSHLAAIHSREMLAASFAREAGHRWQEDRGPDGAGHDGRLTPLQVAYALRWLELDPRHGRPAGRTDGPTSGGDPID